MTDEQITQALQSYGLKDNPAMLKRIQTYLDLVIKWRRRINISGYRSSGELWREYVLDSLRLVKYLQGRVLLDVGSGAGAPGLVLAMVCEDLEVVLTELRHKKLAFLKRAVAELELSHRVRVINPDQHENGLLADTVTLRAVTDLLGSIKLGKEAMGGTGRILMPRGERDLENALLMDLKLEVYPWAPTGSRRIIAIYDRD